MATDLTVELEDRPGMLASLGETLGTAGVNIEALTGTTREGRGEIHVLVGDDAAARSALEDAGITVGDSREVLVLPIEDRPGALGEVTRRIADAGVNLDLAYLATNTRLVLGVSDIQAAWSAVEG